MPSAHLFKIRSHDPAFARVLIIEAGRLALFMLLFDEQQYRQKLASKRVRTFTSAHGLSLEPYILLILFYVHYLNHCRGCEVSFGMLFAYNGLILSISEDDDREATKVLILQSNIS